MAAEKKLKKMEEDLFTELYFERNISLINFKKAVKNLPGMGGCSNKESYCKALASFVFNEELFEHYITSLPPVHFEFLIKCVYSWGMRFSNYAVLFNIKLPERSIYSYSYNYSNIDYPFAWCIDYIDDSIEIGPAMKEALEFALNPYQIPIRVVESESLESLPGYFSENQGLEFYNNALSVMFELKNYGFFERKSGLSITKPIREKILRIIQLSPFLTAHKTMELGYPLEQAEKMEKLRMDLCLVFLSVCFNIEANPDVSNTLIPSEPLEFYTYCVERFFNSSEIQYSLKYLMPHIKVQQMSEKLDVLEDYYEEIAPIVFKMFSKWQFSTPILFSSFLDYAQTFGFPSLILPERWYYCSLYKKYSNITWFQEKKTTLEAADFRQLVYEPSYTNLFFLLSSLGLFEITWEKPFSSAVLNSKDYEAQNNITLYPFGKISIISMTALGRAVFGITTSFESTAVVYNPPELYEDDTLVRIDAEDRVMHLFLDQFCSKVGTGLYKADPIKLTYAVKNPERLQTFLKSLSGYAKRPLPVIWEDLGKSISKTKNKLQLELDWIVLPLAEYNTDTVNIVLKTIESARIGYKRMEGTRIAFDKKDWIRLKGRLEDAGFSVH